MCDWYRPDSYHSKFKRECEDIIARRMAEAIASIGREEHEPTREPRRNSSYYEESHRLHQAQLLKR